VVLTVNLAFFAMLVVSGKFIPQRVVLVRCRRLQDLLVHQGMTKSTRKKSQELVVSVKVRVLKGLCLVSVSGRISSI